MRAEAFRQFQDPTPPRDATRFATAPERPDPVYELSQVLARLVESQQLLIREVREAAQRPTAPRDDCGGGDDFGDGPGGDPGDEPGGGTIITYDWAPSPVISPW